MNVQKVTKITKMLARGKFLKRAYFSWNMRLSACCVNDLIINQSSHAYSSIVNTISIDHDSCDAIVVIAAAFADGSRAGGLIIIKLPRTFGDSVLFTVKMSADRISQEIIIAEEK